MRRFHSAVNRLRSCRPPAAQPRGHPTRWASPVGVRSGGPAAERRRARDQPTAGNRVPQLESLTHTGSPRTGLGREAGLDGGAVPTDDSEVPHQSRESSSRRCRRSRARRAILRSLPEARRDTCSLIGTVQRQPRQRLQRLHPGCHGLPAACGGIPGCGIGPVVLSTARALGASPPLRIVCGAGVDLALGLAYCTDQWPAWRLSFPLHPVSGSRRTFASVVLHHYGHPLRTACGLLGEAPR